MVTDGVSWDMTNLTHRVVVRSAAAVKKDPQAGPLLTQLKGPSEGMVWLKDVQPLFAKFGGLRWGVREVWWNIEGFPSKGPLGSAETTRATNTAVKKAQHLI